MGARVRECAGTRMCRVVGTQVCVCAITHCFKCVSACVHECASVRVSDGTFAPVCVCVGGGSAPVHRPCSCTSVWVRGYTSASMHEYASARVCASASVCTHGCAGAYVRMLTYSDNACPCHYAGMPYNKPGAPAAHYIALHVIIMQYITVHRKVTALHYVVWGSALCTAIRCIVHRCTTLQ